MSFLNQKIRTCFSKYSFIARVRLHHLSLGKASASDLWSGGKKESKRGDKVRGVETGS